MQLVLYKTILTCCMAELSSARKTDATMCFLAKCTRHSMGIWSLCGIAILFRVGLMAFSIYQVHDGRGLARIPSNSCNIRPQAWKRINVKVSRIHPFLICPLEYLSLPCRTLILVSNSLTSTTRSSQMLHGMLPRFVGVLSLVSEHYWW